MKIKDFVKDHKKEFIIGGVTIGVGIASVIIFRKASTVRGANQLAKEAIEFTASVARDVYDVRDILLTPDVRGRDCILSIVVKETGELLGTLDICEAIGDRILMDLEKDVAPIFVRIPERKPPKWIFKY